ncbi:hypothetical protein WOLCODRAFT_137402 [Wolfiporia cocos MD-104 SS10]|uniref:Uncharacterized protein n=1 Tax=Wolfiporia cocos (strain MD-104) TaxID=742152 RepID=A0A2H3JHW1_WOLCO|nr:hypothetical protein WOLCODRAFT_137402 [Wolfiporia cocos MD-104 SS10]
MSLDHVLNIITMPNCSRALQELPLQHFLPPAVPSATSKRVPPNKRPHSPGTTSCGTPAKRRVLAEDIIMDCTDSAMNTLRVSSNGRFPSAYFNALLHGPNSPAKKLEFTPASPFSDFGIDVGRVDLPVKAPSTSAAMPGLFPSPRLFERVHPSATRTPQDDSDDEMDWEAEASPSYTLPLPSIMLTAPEDITITDRLSDHYPGFDICRDAFSRDPGSLGSSFTPEAPMVEDDSYTPRTAIEKETEKENVAPRKRPRKPVSKASQPGEAAWFKAGLLPPSVLQESALDSDPPAAEIPVTPRAKHSHVCGDVQSGLKEGSPTPTRRSMRLREKGERSVPIVTAMSVSPDRVPVGSEQRLGRRRAMREEVDSW